MSELSIRRVAIVGAGITGGALAAYLTNLGFSITLIDLAPSGAAAGLEPVRAGLYVAERAGEIRTLGLEEGAATFGEYDWIVEALPERIEAKREVYAEIAFRMRADAIVTTCSPSLPIEELARGLSDDFAARFLGANFVLPLADHHLVEVRPGLDAALAKSVARFLEEGVARRAVVVPDGPGGVVARYGLWCLFLGVQTAEKLRLDVEDVEAITSGFFGDERVGIFGATDRIGLVELRNVAANLQERLVDDRGARYWTLPSTMTGLLARGWTGDRAGRGYYRREGRERLALNLATMAYRQARDADLPGLRANVDRSATDRIQAALGKRDEVGEYLREFLVVALRYAEYLREAMGVPVVDFDRVMEWGFGWEKGPFRMLDALRLGTRRYYEGGGSWNGSRYEAIPSDEHALALSDLPILVRGEGYAVRDLGEGAEAIVLEPGTLTPARVRSLVGLLSGRRLERFVLVPEARDYPDLDLDFVVRSARDDASALDGYLAGLQLVGEGLDIRRGVAAIPGRCAGPSFGLALSCSLIVASAEATVGFPEARLGIVPTARGIALMRNLHGGSTKSMADMATMLAEGTIAPNADLARATGLLRPDDVTEYMPERILKTARERLKDAVPRERPTFAPVDGPLVGIIDRGLNERRQRGALTELDVAIGHRIRQVLARAPGYEECLDQERRETIELGARALSQARLRHMIETGKPLRN